MASNLIARVVHNYTHAATGSKFLNTYYYRLNPEAEWELSDIAGLAIAWSSVIYPLVRNIMSTGLQTTIIRAERVDGLWFSEIDRDNEPGLRSGATPPQFVSIAIRLLRGNGSTRTGWKRYPVAEQAAAPGGSLFSPGAGYSSALNALAAALVGPITGTDYTHVIYRRPCPDCLPPRAEAWQDVFGVLRAAYVGTQNTRKVGRGQ